MTANAAEMNSGIGPRLLAYWHDDIGKSFGALMAETDAFLLGRRTYVVHAQAFEPLPPGGIVGPRPLPLVLSRNFCIRSTPRLRK
jgi:hypothetical protein